MMISSEVMALHLVNGEVEELLGKIFDFPDDGEAEPMRSKFHAEDFEKRDQPGSSLAWYLKARQLYPASTFAKAGIQRLGQQVLPDAK